MSASSPMRFALDLLAEWRAAGHAIDLAEYLAVLRPHGRADAAAHFRRLAASTSADPQLVQRIEGAILADDPTWTDQVVLLVLWPEFEDHFADVPGAIAAWQEAPLGVRLSCGHVRSLAIRRLAGPTPLGDAEFDAMFTLFDIAQGEPARDWRSAFADDSSTRVLLAAAFPFWGTCEMVPAVMVQVARWSLESKIDAREMVRLLKQVAKMIEFSPPGDVPKDPRGDLMAQLRFTFASIAWAWFDGKKPLAGSAVLDLAGYYTELAELLRSPVADPARRGGWFRHTAAVAVDASDGIATLGCDPAALREAWALDMIGSLTTPTVPDTLRATLFSAWLGRPAGADPATRVLAELFAAAHAAGMPPAEQIILSALKAAVASDPLGVASHLPWVRSTWGIALPAAFRLSLLASVGAQPPETAARQIEALRQWTAAPSGLERAVGRAAEHLDSHIDPALRLILWEALLGPANHRPTLRGAVMRAWNLASADPAWRQRAVRLSCLLPYLLT